MFWRVRGVVVVGAAVTLSLLFLVLVLGTRFFPDPMPEGVVLEGPSWYVRVTLSVLVPLSCLLVACSLGGLLAGALAATHPGPNGAAGVALALASGFVWLIWGLVPSLFVTPSNPGEVFTISDNVGTLTVLTLAFCATFPFGVLAGFLGGKLGGWLRGPTRS